MQNLLTMISYIGGKSRMAKWIGEYIPENKTYVEVFGGAFWVQETRKVSFLFTKV